MSSVIERKMPSLTYRLYGTDTQGAYKSFFVHSFAEYVVSCVSGDCKTFLLYKNLNDSGAPNENIVQNH